MLRLGLGHVNRREIQPEIHSLGFFVSGSSRSICCRITQFKPSPRTSVAQILRQRTDSLSGFCYTLSSRNYTGAI